MKVSKYQRGQIWWYETNTTFDGNVQGKSRPVIIISNYKANENSNNVTIIPCTTRIKNMYLPTHISFYLNNIQNIALCENILTINKEKLNNYEGTCDEELMTNLEKGIKIALGLEQIPDKNIENSDKSSNSTDTGLDILDSKPKGRKPKYNKDEMQRFVNDYNNHNIDYMIDKYDECSEKAVQSKVYRFRKILAGGS